MGSLWGGSDATDACWAQSLAMPEIIHAGARLRALAFPARRLTTLPIRIPISTGSLMKSFAAALSALVFVSLLPGCGSGGPELTGVKGVVTLDGKPVNRAIVTFVPEGGGSPSYGQTDAQGRYELMFTRTKYGAMPGRHNVEIQTQELTPQDIAEYKAHGEEVPEDSPAIPEKYLEAGALTADVKPGENEINFPLTSE
jgi:hypothetical protein